MPRSKVRKPAVVASISNTAAIHSLPFTIIPIPTPPRIALTPKQRNVLVWIMAYKIIHGYTPTSQEIRDGMGIRSPNEILGILRNLAKRGWIKKDFAKSGRRLARSIELLGDDLA